MSRARKHGADLPLRVEARLWRNGTTVTYRYLAPTGEKVYLGTDREQALAAYERLTQQRSGAVDPRVAEALALQNAAGESPCSGLVRFHARATLNAAGEPAYSHMGISAFPTTSR